MHGIPEWHVGGHQDLCTPRYAPTYMTGAGLLDGEIIETLWVPMNDIASSTRYMSAAYRQETIDLHMNDVNWKKITRTGGCNILDNLVDMPDTLIPIVPALLRKWKAIHAGVAASQEEFQAIVKTITASHRRQWIILEECAQMERKTRIGAMDIYDVQSDKEPSKADIQVELLEEEAGDAVFTGSSQWISTGMKIRDQQ